MKTILLSLVTLQLSLGAVASALEVAVIQTIHGKSYRHCKIVQRDPDGVAFTHQKGTARVLFSDLPEAMRSELGYNAKSAAALEQSRTQAKAAKIKADRLRQKRQTELLHAARLAEIKHLSQQQSIIVMQQAAAAFGGPVPAVGFAAPGWGGGYGGPYHKPMPRRNQGWDNVGMPPSVPAVAAFMCRKVAGSFSPACRRCITARLWATTILVTPAILHCVRRAPLASSPVLRHPQRLRWCQA